LINNSISQLEYRQNIAVEELEGVGIRVEDLGEYHHTVDVLKESLKELSKYDEEKANEISRKLDNIWDLSQMEY